jgi:diguanylate cyclase (GGDEF)-like protein/hemerythrin-like metal-binding protein
MPEATIQRLLGPEAREIFMQFPLPLALVHDTGLRQFNTRFSRFFDQGCIDTTALRDILGAPGQGWQPVSIPALDGRQADLYAQAMAVPQGRILVLGESAQVMHDPELDQLRRRIAELEKVSATDYLTGAWNRAHLVRVVASEMARSVRFRQPLSALLIDIDHFKQVNDTHGHQAGDSVLCELVDIVQRKIRTADLLFRWGGEEFVVLAVSTGYRDAEVLAEHLRARVENHPFAANGRLTVSIGVAERSGDETADQWFQRLDAALFTAKNGGRNRVVTDLSGDSDRWVAEGGLATLRLVWRENYACGEARIDAEHRELFDLANELINLALPGANQDSARTEAALVALLQHLDSHFRHEEAILAERGYARLEEHRNAHASLLRRAGELHALAKAGGSTTFGALVDFLASDVVSRHLMTADRDYYPLFQANRT